MCGSEERRLQLLPPVAAAAAVDLCQRLLVCQARAISNCWCQRLRLSWPRTAATAAAAGQGTDADAVLMMMLRIDSCCCCCFSISRLSDVEYKAGVKAWPYTREREDEREGQEGIRETEREKSDGETVSGR